MGFGDVAPATQLGRGLAVAYIPIGMAVLVNTAGNIAQLWVHFSRGDNAGQHLPLSVLVEMDTSNDGLVSRREFLTFMLLQLHRVDAEELDVLLAQFQALVKAQNHYQPDAGQSTTTLDLKAIDNLEHLECEVPTW